MSEKLLIVEDDKKLNDGIRLALKNDACKRDHSGTKGVYKSDIKERKGFYIFCVSSDSKEGIVSKL